MEEAARAQPGEGSAATLDAVLERTRASTVSVDLDLARSIIRQPDLSPTATPWQFAERAAADLRALIGLTRGPLKNQPLADLLQARWADLKEATATAREFAYGARLVDVDGKARLSLQTRAPKDRRFELARFFGDAIWQPGSEFGITSKSKTDRQKFQRAFAHSLLCPFDDLRRVVDVNAPTPEAIQAAANQYRVHVTVVRNQLAYRGYLPFDTIGLEGEAV